MSIQASINQPLSVAGMLLHLNPAVQEAAKKRGEIKGLESKAKREKEMVEAIKPGLNIPGTTQIASAEEIAEVGKGAADTAKALFELDPSMERYADYVQTKQITAEAEHMAGTMKRNQKLEQRRKAMEEAQAALQIKQEDKRQSRSKSGWAVK